jgi:hypothetical protein
MVRRCGAGIHNSKTGRAQRKDLSVPGGLRLEHERGFWSRGLAANLQGLFAKTMTLDFNSQSPAITPLETLVVQQLAEMLREERTLQERYRQLKPSASSAERDSFSDELSKFNARATRLYRMMEAMEGCCSGQTLARSLV